jgi:uncharacterized damage-inducible protein DinB
MQLYIDTFQILFQRELDMLKQEIASYKDEKSLWIVEQQIANSAGNLCLHLIGNLNTFIGANLGKTGYVRHREQEFSTKGTPRKVLIQQIEATQQTVAQTLQQLAPTTLSEPYPLEVFGEPMTTHFFLTHLVAHLTYHLGQINYHRRMLDSI